MKEAATTLACVMFLVAGIWVGRRRRGPDEAVLATGLLLVACAVIVRLDRVETFLAGTLPPAVPELLKHLLIVVGCLCIGAYAEVVVGPGAIRRRRLMGVIVAIVATMVAAFHASGPWKDLDLSDQAVGHPWMIVYWVAYYAAFVWAQISLLLPCTAVLVGPQRPRRWRWLLITLAGTGAGLAWAVLSIVRECTAADGATPAWIDVWRQPLAAVFPILLMAGVGGFVAHSAVDQRRHHHGMTALHRRLTRHVHEVQLLAVSDVVARYHRDIEIRDGLAALHTYSDVADADVIRRIDGDLSPSGLHACQIELAAERRGLDLRSRTPAAWDWAEDDDELARVGDVMSRPGYEEMCDRVTARARLG